MIVQFPILPVLFVLFLSTLTRSTFGFGDALVAMPFLALFIPVRTATPIVALIATTIAVSILIKGWRSVDLKSTWRLIISTLVGIPLGLLFLKHLDEKVAGIILALVIILFSIFNLVRSDLIKLKDERFAFFFGFIGGILGGAYNTNGPPVIFYGALRGWKPESFRATLQGYFLPTGGAILIGHGLAGLWTKTVWNAYLLSLPLVLAAVFIGGRINRRIPADKFARYVYIALVVLGAVLLFKTAFILK